MTVGPVLVEEPAGLSRLSLRPPEWTRESACSSPDVDAAWWHSTQSKERARARAVCAGCPVRLRCAIDALERADRHGIWGGLDLEDRRKVARRFGYPQPGAARHGTRSCYVAGCRCPDCRRAHAVYEHARRLQVAERHAKAQRDRDRKAGRRRRARAAAQTVAAVEATKPPPVIVETVPTACPRAGLPWRPTRRRSIRSHPLQLLADL